MISIDSLKFSYGQNTVLENIGMKLEEGKTTLLSLICGLKKPQEGTVEIDGRNPWRREPSLLGAVAFRRHKIIKTMLCMMGLSVGIGFVATPVMIALTFGAIGNEDMLISNFTWIAGHLALLDTIGDTLINCALAAGIWYRIRTMKF